MANLFAFHSDWNPPIVPLRASESLIGSTSDALSDIPGRFERYAGSRYGTTVFSPSLPPPSVTMTRIGVPAGKGVTVAAWAISSKLNVAATDAAPAMPVYLR